MPAYRTSRSDRIEDYCHHTLREARCASGHTIRSLAKEVGVSSTTISQYEHLRRAPRPEVARRIEHALQHAPGYLFPPSFNKIFADVNNERRRRGAPAPPLELFTDLEAQGHPIEAEDARPDPISCLLSQERKAILHQATAALPPQQQTIIKHLFFNQEHTPPERTLARTLGYTHASLLRYHKKKALRTIAYALKQPEAQDIFAPA